MLKLNLLNKLKINNCLYHSISKNYRKSDIIQDYDKEMVVYKKNLKEARKLNQRLFWENQTQVENEFIEEHREIQANKHYRDTAKFNNSIIKDAMKTHRNIVSL